MQQEILIHWTPQETRVAVVEDGVLQEIEIERALERGLLGNIYLGKVARVLPGMQSAFVELGLDRSGFIHVGDLLSSVQARATQGDAAFKPCSKAWAQPVPIEKQLFQGQTLLVQVTKEPVGTKGPRLTNQISIPGRWLVFLPQDNHLGVSQKIPAQQREALRQRLHTLAQGLPGGFILRTSAQDATDAQLQQDMAYLRKTWACVEDLARRRAPGSLLHQDLSLLQRVVRDCVRDETQTIRIDSKEQHAHLQAFAADFLPACCEKIQLYEDTAPIFDLFQIEQEITHALERRVALKSGGDLVVEQAEALTVIDVNTGKFVGTDDFDQTIFKTNLEAVREIARQLRLRNLGGVVVVDLIDMASDQHRQAVLEEFQKQLALDRIKTKVDGYSPLGLLEMTRQRTRASLTQKLCEPCFACHGMGMLKTTRSVAYALLRDIEHKTKPSKLPNVTELKVMVSPDVADFLSKEGRAHVLPLGQRIGVSISIQAQPLFVREHYGFEWL